MTSSSIVTSSLKPLAMAESSSSTLFSISPIFNISSSSKPRRSNFSLLLTRPINLPLSLKSRTQSNLSPVVTFVSQTSDWAEEEGEDGSIGSASVAVEENEESFETEEDGGVGFQEPSAGFVRCSMKSHRLSQLSLYQVESLKARPRIDFSSIFNTVNPIIDAVRIKGDSAVKEYTERFDKVQVNKVVEDVSELSVPELDSAVKEAFDVAYDNIYAFHLAQKSTEKSVENMKGVRCKRVSRSIGSVGLYVPGGTAVLPSTALMLAIPAQIAGCKTVVLATPPTKEGSICKEVLYCAKRAGVTHILKTGGAQAIAAMAWGTDSCPKVEKIFGPGNQYVTAAKMILQNSEAMVSIDMPAGPSEVLVIADEHASPVYIAADLLSQAEHGPDSQVVLVLVGDGVNLKAIEEEIAKQCKSLPRGEFASKALSHSFTVFARDMTEAIAFSNMYAPEHLIINVKDAEKWEGLIENAGSVFIGPWTPESVGDYASGTNHVLPTYGYARMYSGVSLDSFLKFMTVQSLTEEGLRNLGPYVATMAEIEGLDAHKRAVTLRLEDIEAKQLSQTN